MENHINYKRLTNSNTNFYFEERIPSFEGIHGIIRCFVDYEFGMPTIRFRDYNNEPFNKLYPELQFAIEKILEDLFYEKHGYFPTFKVKNDERITKTTYIRLPYFRIRVETNGLFIIDTTIDRRKY